MMMTTATKMLRPGNATASFNVLQDIVDDGWIDASTREVIADLPFPDTIAAVRLDRQKLVVVEARRATIFDLATLAVSTLDLGGAWDGAVDALAGDGPPAPGVAAAALRERLLALRQHPRLGRLLGRLV